MFMNVYLMDQNGDDCSTCEYTRERGRITALLWGVMWRIKDKRPMLTGSGKSWRIQDVSVFESPSLKSEV